MVVGSWWLRREIELATVRAGLLSLHGGVASLLLPASKTDTQAFGASRSHRCGCGQGRESPGCPYHAAWDQLPWLRRTFPMHFDPLGHPHRDLPLFPDEMGRTVTKARMSESIVHAARLLGVQDAPDGAERVSGPSTPGSSSASSSSPLSPGSSPSEVSRWVINLETGVHHVITRHSPSTSVCGWDFEDMEHAVVPPGAPGPVGHWDVCGLCDPELKGAMAAEERSRCEG